MNKKQLFRSKADRVIAGVCGGIAQYADMDSTAVRAGFAALTVFTAGKGLLLYTLIAKFRSQRLHQKKAKCVSQNLGRCPHN